VKSVAKVHALWLWELGGDHPTLCGSCQSPWSELPARQSGTAALSVGGSAGVPSSCSSLKVKPAIGPPVVDRPGPNGSSESIALARASSDLVRPAEQHRDHGLLNMDDLIRDRPDCDRFTRQRRFVHFDLVSELVLRVRYIANLDCR
jgi:hypothetical protein